MARIYCSQCGAHITDDDRFGDTMLYSTCETCTKKARDRKKPTNPGKLIPVKPKKEYVQ